MSGKLLCIIPGPTKVIHERDLGEKWCFGCRKRLPHKLQVLADVEPSYYDPVVVVRCSRCGKDRTQFPQAEEA